LNEVNLDLPAEVDGIQSNLNAWLFSSKKGSASVRRGRDVKQRRIFGIICFLTMAMGSLSVHAQQEQANSPVTQEQAVELGVEHIYGSELMTAPERNVYRSTLRSLKTDAERQKFIEAHRKAMQDRAWAVGFGTPENAKAIAQSGGTFNDCMGDKCGHTAHEQQKSFHNYLHYGG
jgi:hypothetical protein